MEQSFPKKPNKVIIFLDRKFHLCKAFGLFGKENLIFRSDYDPDEYHRTDFVKYYFPELDADIIFLSREEFLENLNLSQYTNGIISVSETDMYSKKYEEYRKKYSQFKLIFVWMYGEVLSKQLFERCKEAKLDLILTASYQFGIDEIAVFDPKLCFKFFYYYIGYYYIDSLMNKIGQIEYDKSKLPIFAYSKAKGGSEWRSEILNKLNQKFPNKIYSTNNTNDSYDLEFTKYKHFETINDYAYRNYNLIFETINYLNNKEAFLTEKTFKGLFFGNPFYLIAPTFLIKELRKDFYLLNYEFENEDDFVGSTDLESKFSYFKEKSKVNRIKLMEYIKDYKYTEHFKKLLNETRI